MISYHARSYIPSQVQQARTLAQQLGFTSSSLPEVGRLLAVLTAALPHGRIAEIGTGCGVGTAWMASALHAGAAIVTIDTNGDYVDAVRRIFAGDPRVRVLHGDWHELTGYGPFQLLFADGGRAKAEHPEAVVDLVTLGGMIVLDDLTPEEYWPEAWQGRVDATRQFWLNTPRVVATELRVTERHGVIVATRVQ